MTMAKSLRKMDSVTLIISPYHVGIREDAVGAGPNRLLERGLSSAIKALGVEVHQVTVEPSIEAEGDIGRSFELFRQTSKLVTEARNASSFPIVVSGNCSASVGVHAGLSGCAEFRESEVGCVWFDVSNTNHVRISIRAIRDIDPEYEKYGHVQLSTMQAHDDFNIPDTILSGYFDGMPIATMAGQSWKALVQTIPGFRPMKLDHFVHCGLRDVNDLERNRVTEAGYPVVWGSAEERVNFAEELARILEKGERNVSMVHLDLDCLDQSVGQVNKFKPTSGGLLVDDLMKCMKMLPEVALPTSLTVAGYDPRFDTGGNISVVAIQSISAFVESLLVNEYLLRNK